MDGAVADSDGSGLGEDDVAAVEGIVGMEIGVS